jgi:hypothetical protein
MGPYIVRYKGGIYDKQDATNSQYFIVVIALHVSGDHCPSSGARNCMCSRTVYKLCASLFGRLYSNHGVGSKPYHTDTEMYL